MKEFRLTDLNLWATLSGCASATVNSTAPGEMALITEELHAALTSIANLNGKQIVSLALAMMELEAKEEQK